MVIKHIHTTSDKLNLLPIVNGQIIALEDSDKLFYDMNDERHEVGAYSAGDGVSISSENVISVTGLQEGDMDDIIENTPTINLLYLDDLGDTGIVNAADGEELVWDSVQGKWVNGYINAVKCNTF